MSTPPDRIALVVSDIDGTLVTNDKVLTPRVIASAKALAKAGIALSLVSSRPPVGFSMMTGPLELTHPIGAFNGGALVRPDLTLIEQELVPEKAVRIALDTFAEMGVDSWLFTNESWFVLDPQGALVPKETHTIGTDPIVVSSFDPYVTKVGKLVGSTRDYPLLARCESVLQERLGGLASAHRSQPYYLDVTPANATKGHAATRIAAHLGIPMSQVAVIGDAANDLSMFAVAGLAIAMGNGVDEIKAATHFVTETNEHDGFAVAMERFILPRH